MSIARFSELSIAQGFPKYRSALAGNDAYLPTAYEFISAVSVTSSTSTVTFSSIPQTYKHLQVRGIAKSELTSNYTAGLYNTINGVGTSSYHYQEFGAYNNARLVGSNLNVSSLIFPGAVASNSHAASTYGTFVIDYFDYYKTDRYKIAHCHAGNAPGNSASFFAYAFQTGGIFTSNNAITSLEFFATYNFKSGTYFSLYGIKG